MKSITSKQKAKIDRIRVLALYGTAQLFVTVEEAIVYLKKQPFDSRRAKPLVRFEVQVRYSDCSRIEGQFPHKYGAIEFLKNRMQGLLWPFWTNNV